MTQNINVKKDSKVGIRKALIPLGIITAITSFLYILFYTFGAGITDINQRRSLMNVGRYFAMPACFLTLALAALMLTHSIMQLAKLKKANVKWEITSGIINTIVGIALFTSFIVTIITVFDENKWFAGNEAYNIWKNCAFMGVMAALSIYATCLGRHYDKGLEDKNTNLKMLRVIGVSVLVIVICNILPVALTMLGGFQDPKNISESSKLVWTASSFACKFALGCISTVALGILCMIPLAILGINNDVVKEKNIVMWSVIGGIAFVLFLIPAIMMSLIHGAPEKWIGNDAKNIVITVFILLGEIYSIVASGIANVKTKQLVFKTARAPQ